MKSQPPSGRVYHMKGSRQFLAVFLTAFGVFFILGIFIVPLLKHPEAPNWRMSLTALLVFLARFSDHCLLHNIQRIQVHYLFH